MEENKKSEEEKAKLADRKVQRHALLFDRKSDSAKILLKRFKQRHAFEETREKKNKDSKT
jgi:hypothetical protein